MPYPSAVEVSITRKTRSCVVGGCHSLAKDVCCQIEDRLRKAHAGFESSMQRLEKCYTGRLRKTESQSLSLRKKLAPRIARLALESRSLRDFVVHGQYSQRICLLFL